MFSQTILVGRLGQDPEVNYTNSGTAVATLSVATTSSFKNNDGEWEKRTEWHRAKVWGARAETISEYLSKGSAVLIVGHNQTRKWEDSEGNTKYTTEVVADTVQFLDKKQDSEQEDAPAPKKKAAAASKGNGKKPNVTKPSEEKDFLADDSDIPF